MREPESPIAKVRNSLSPIVNYFFMIKELETNKEDEEELKKFLEQELNQIQNHSLPRLLELIQDNENWK